MWDLLSNDEFMSRMLGASVWLMFVALGWKATSENPGLARRGRARRRSRRSPFFWLGVAVMSPVLFPVLLIRRTQEAWRRRAWVAAARRQGWRLR
jgi:hypothetical protein